MEESRGGIYFCKARKEYMKGKRCGASKESLYKKGKGREMVLNQPQEVIIKRLWVQEKGLLFIYLCYLFIFCMDVSSLS